jgi:hypothetical protein
MCRMQSNAWSKAYATGVRDWAKCALIGSAIRSGLVGGYRGSMAWRSGWAVRTGARGARGDAEHAHDVRWIGGVAGLIQDPVLPQPGGRKLSPRYVLCSCVIVPAEQGISAIGGGFLAAGG